MTDQDKKEIERISKEFAEGFKPEIPEIAGSGFLIVDPLSAYLSVCGYENSLNQIPAKGVNPLVLVMTFKDGTRFIPAGSDLPVKGVKDWTWLD